MGESKVFVPQLHKAGRMSAGRLPIRKDAPLATWGRAAVPTKVAKAATVISWIPGALGPIGEVVEAAVHVDPAGPHVSKAQRLTAVAKTADEFKAGLLARVGAAIDTDPASASGGVKKRSIFAGWL